MKNTFTVHLLDKEYTLSEQKVQVLSSKGCTAAEIRAYAKYEAFAHVQQSPLWEIEWAKFQTENNGFGLAMFEANILARRGY